jgi:hypothetical protein
MQWRCHLSGALEKSLTRYVDRQPRQFCLPQPRRSHRHLRYRARRSIGLDLGFRQHSIGGPSGTEDQADTERDAETGPAMAATDEEAEPASGQHGHSGDTIAQQPRLKRSTKRHDLKIFGHFASNRSKPESAEPGLVRRSDYRQA